MTITIGGTGTVKISGETDSQAVFVTGSGEYRAEDLRSKEAKVAVAGAGSAVVKASDSLDAKVSGAGSVEYIGDPTVDQDVSEAGRVGEH